MQHINSKPAPLPKQILSQFATYSNAISRIIVGTTFLVISFLASLPEVSQAQPTCPSGYTVGPFEIFSSLPGGCSFGIWYCDSIYDGGDSIKSYIEEIDLDTSSPCNFGNYDSVVQLAGIAVNQDRAEIPNCSMGAVTIRSVYQAVCWTPQIFFGNMKLTPCETIDELGFCIYTCTLCYDQVAGHLDSYNCAYTTDGFTPDCSTGPWMFNTCHVVGCGSY
jgi:hypothetical protein